jgi:hypothetical protein
MVQSLELVCKSLPDKNLGDWQSVSFRSKVSVSISQHRVDACSCHNKMLRIVRRHSIASEGIKISDFEHGTLSDTKDSVEAQNDSDDDEVSSIHSPAL